MRRKRLLWQLYPSYLLITLIALLAVAWYASRSLRQFYLKELASDLEARAILVAKQASERPSKVGTANGQLTSADTKYVDSLCKELGKKTSTRITVILPSGKVIGDSEEDPGRMDNHATRPEVIPAMSGRIGASTRFSHTVRRNMMYVAIPLEEDGKVMGVVRTSIPVTSIDQALRAIHIKTAIAGLVIAVLAAAISLVISRRISRSLEELKLGSERFARGDLSHRLSVPDSEEIGGLAEAMNQMAAQLDDRMRTVIRQRSEEEAVLSSMVEGVLAVDTEEHLIILNQAAAQLIGVNPDEVQGQTIQEVVRNIDLQRFIAKTLSSEEPIEGDILLREDGERSLQAHGTVLRDAQGSGIGALVVLNDVTRLKRLENVRRDFVANVSHELRTPITSIKGFVETLRDGAMNDREDAKRFLAIILRQADRLNAIIEDLLSLSRIEQEAENEEIVLGEGKIKDVLQSAVQNCNSKASEKQVRISLSCNEAVSVKINQPLLEQAVMNLTDNAIKYSEQGSEVQVRATQTDAEVIIDVRDQGFGIEKEHLPRLFERFYRVDKARSRKLGGTGLGLAIVKHIAQAHGGRVTVESTPGEGSVFTIHLPKV